MVNPAHENTPKEEFDRLDPDELSAVIPGPGGQPWRIRALPLAESGLLHEDPVLWVVEDETGGFQDLLMLPEDLRAFLGQTEILPEADEAPTLFPLGKVLITPGAAAALGDAGMSIETLVTRHAQGDWGDLDAHDRSVNRQALRNGQRLLSAYTLSETGAKIWVITEADRQSTTLLLPSEY